MHVTVWTQQDEQDAWLRTQVFRPAPNLSDPPLLKNLYGKWSGFDKGMMLVLHECGGVFVVDLEEEVIEKVMDCSPSMYSWQLCPRERFVPYEMDLVDFFVSRLGGGGTM